MTHSNTAAGLKQTQPLKNLCAFAARLLLCLVCFFAFGVAAAADDNNGDGGDGGAALLRKFWTQTPSARAQFRQLVFDDGGEVLSDGGGRFWFARGGRFRVEYQQPDELLLVSDGESFWSYEKDLRQVVVRPLATLGGGFLAALSAGEWDTLLRLYVLSDGGADGDMQWVAAKSKNSEDTVRHILFGFDDGGALRQLKMRDAFGGRVRVDIIGLTFGAADEFFVFTPPPDAEIISDL